jgi:hypothetical protein
MSEYRATDGAVIIFSVWHHEALLPNVFLGEVVLPLSQLRQLTVGQTVDDVPVVMMPLVRPKEPREGPYKVCFSVGGLWIVWQFHSGCERHELGLYLAV